MAKINVINSIKEQPIRKSSGESPHAKKHTAWLIGGIVFVILVIAAIGYVLMTSEGPLAGQAIKITTNPSVNKAFTLGSSSDVFTIAGKKYNLVYEMNTLGDSAYLALHNVDSTGFDDYLQIHFADGSLISKGESKELLAAATGNDGSVKVTFNSHAADKAIFIDYIVISKDEVADVKVKKIEDLSAGGQKTYTLENFGAQVSEFIVNGVPYTLELDGGTGKGFLKLKNKKEGITLSEVIVYDNQKSYSLKAGDFLTIIDPIFDDGKRLFVKIDEIGKPTKKGIINEMKIFLEYTTIYGQPVNQGLLIDSKSMTLKESQGGFQKIDGNDYTFSLYSDKIIDQGKITNKGKILVRHEGTVIGLWEVIDKDGKKLSVGSKRAVQLQKSPLKYLLLTLKGIGTINAGNKADDVSIDVQVINTGCIDPDNTFAAPDYDKYITDLNKKSFETKTTVVAGAQKSEDQCSGVSNSIIEAYCKSATDLIWSTYDCPDGMFCNDGACVDTKVFTILPGKSTTISVNHKNFNLKHEVEGYDDDDSFHNLIIKDSSGSTVSSWQVYHEDSDYYTDTNENNKEKKFSQSAFGVYDLIIKITDSEKISGTYKVKQREVVCGNNVIEKEKGEECDNGDQNSDTASCTKACKINVCGDKLVYENIEECDDGNKVDGDGCQANCKNPVCGDNIKDAGEACDTGSQNSNTVKDACRTDCEIASCGDFVIDTGETCDDGTFNGDPNKCNVQCSGTTTGTCGNGVKEGAEECDLGESGDYYNDDLGACTTKCKNHKCGDGLVASGFEQCDDGNTVSGDGCSSSCVDETTYGDLVAPTGIDIQDVLAVVDHIIDKNAQLTGEKLKAANVVGCKTANPVANDIDIQDVLALVDAILDKKASIICSG